MGSGFWSTLGNVASLGATGFATRELMPDSNNQGRNPGMVSTYTGAAPSVAGANAGYGAPPSWFPSAQPKPAPAPTPTMRPTNVGPYGQ